ncbi:unnamed protein product [Lathyrus sativus]|nr:unnamed protein product [Lathyrus sativus]
MIMKAKRSLRQGDPISPFLFMAMMEYLHKSMQKVSKNSDFDFHAKCEKLKIINISFADDLLLFAREDINSIELLMKKMNEFSRATRYLGVPLTSKKLYIHHYMGLIDRIVSRVKN